MAAIRKRGNKWQGRIRIKGLEPIEKSFSNKSDAEAWAKITEAEIIRGVYIKHTLAEQTTLSEALLRYLNEITPHKRGAFQERQRVKTWQSSKLASNSMASLRAHDFAKWRDQRLLDVSPTTVRRDLALISHLFNIARKEWGFEGLANPTEGLRIPTMNNARHRLFYDGEEALLIGAMRPVDRDAKGRLVAGCANPWLKPLVLLALETAMRRGELLALKWQNIRLADRVAHLPMTKNGSSREVPLSSKAIEILESLPRTLRGPVFQTTAVAINLAFPRAVKRARRAYLKNGGQDERMLTDLHFHDLRHIAITQLAEKLPNIIELAAVSGHTDVRMLKRYYHPKAVELARKLG